MWKSLTSKRVLLTLAGLASLALVAAGCASQAAGTPTPSAGGTGGPSGTSQPTPQGGYSVPPEVWAVLSSPERQAALARLAESVAAFPSTGQQAGIWVTGTGKVTATPDLAVLTLGVEARRDTVAGAHADAANAMNRIMDALRKLGIPDKDIRTQYFSIQPEYRYDDFTRRSVLTGYHVSNTVTVKVRDLNKVASVIDSSVAAGGDATRIQGVQFTVENTAALETQAREKAVKDALAKAQQFASLTGAQLGKLVYITESGGYVPQPVTVYRAMEKGAAADMPTPISPGELDVQVSVQAVFGIQ